MPWISTSFARDRRRVVRRLPAVAAAALPFFRAFGATVLRFLADAFFFTALFFAAFLLAVFFATFFFVVFLATFFFFAVFFVAPAFLRTGFFLAEVFRRVVRFGAAFFRAAVLRPDLAAPLRVPGDFLDAFFLAAMLSALRDLYKTRNYTYAAPRVKGF